MCLVQALLVLSGRKKDLSGRESAACRKASKRNQNISLCCHDATLSAAYSQHGIICKEI